MREITRDTKLQILEMFEVEFGIKRNRAIELFSALSYMLKDVMNMASEVTHVLAPSKQDFKQSHVAKLVSMMEKTASLETEVSEDQLAIISAMENEFNFNQEQPKKW